MLWIFENPSQGEVIMKEFKLSTPSEQTAGMAFSAATIVGFGILLYALRTQLVLMIACGLGMLLISALLVLYVINVRRAVCVVDPANKRVEVKGVVNFGADISKAVLLQTLPQKNGQTTSRVLVFSDEDMQIVATIPTMFTHKQGKMAEPMAEEMAAYLGIEFKRNIPEWEFDKKLYEEHQKQVAAEERAAAKERRQKRIAQRINKRKNMK